MARLKPRPFKTFSGLVPPKSGKVFDDSCKEPSGYDGSRGRAELMPEGSADVEVDVDFLVDLDHEGAGIFEAPLDVGHGEEPTA